LLDAFPPYQFLVELKFNIFFSSSPDPPQTTSEFLPQKHLVLTRLMFRTLTVAGRPGDVGHDKPCKFQEAAEKTGGFQEGDDGDVVSRLHQEQLPCNVTMQEFSSHSHESEN
jgi:hypothetical protein